MGQLLQSAWLTLHTRLTAALEPDDVCTVRLGADTLQDDSKSEELKSAASVALGGLTTGAMGAYLPTLLSAAASQVTCHVVCDYSTAWPSARKF